MKKRFSLTISIASLLLFIVVVNFSIDEKVKPVEPKDKVLTVEKINAKYETRKKEKEQLIITAINNIVLEKFKRKYKLNLKGYKFKGIDTFPKTFIAEYFNNNPNPNLRNTFAYIKDKRGFIFDKNPNSGENRLLLISKRNNQWEMTKQKKVIGEKYNGEFIRSIERDIKKKYKNGN